MFLDTVNKKIQALTDAGATTTEPKFVTSYGDVSTTTFATSATAGSDGVLNGTTAVDLIAVPGASTLRTVQEIQIYNADSVTHTITVRLLDSATPYILVAAIVPAGNFLRYSPGTGWQIGAVLGPGTVTSVAMTGDGTVFNAAVSGSPVTSSGTLAPSLHTQAANVGLFGPTTGAAAAPTFRALVAADIPDLSATYQPLDADLTAIAALAATAGMVSRTGAGAFAVRTLSTSSPLTWTNPTGSAGAPSIDFSAQSANTVLAGATSGGVAAPAFRSLVAADIPSLSATYLPLTGGTMSGAIANAVGSASLPSYTFAGNTGYGYFFDSTNTGVGISIGGSQIGQYTAVGLFLSNPGSSINVSAAGETACLNQVQLSIAGNTGPVYSGIKTRGTIASPADVILGDTLLSIRFRGYASGNKTGSELKAVMTETATVSSTAFGNDHVFSAMAIGSGTLTEYLRGNPGFGIQATLSDATTNVMSDVATWKHNTSGTAAANFGLQHTWNWENASGVQRDGGRFGFRWLTATNTSEDSEFVISTIQGGTLAEKVRVTPRGYVVSPGNTRVAADFSKTTDTTLANITGLSVNVAAGKTYHFEVALYYAADAVGGHKYAIAGTATATDIRYHIQSVADATNLNVITSTQTALAGSAGQAGSTAGMTVISGTITVNAAGTLTVQFAENASSGTSTIKRGSTFIVTEID